VYAGLILSFFAFAPGWILFHLLLDLVDPTQKADLSFANVLGFLGLLAICTALFLFLALLAYRAFTGRGRKSDGGLLPPLALQIFAVLFGALALAVVTTGVYHDDFRAIRGGIIYVGAAITLYGIARWRKVKARGNA